MPETSTDSKRLFILDTNVLMHDPTALFRFQEHDVYLPMVVLEEMDAGKKGVSEVARNVRQVSRFLDELMQSAGTDNIETGHSAQHPRTWLKKWTRKGAAACFSRPTR